MAALQEIHQAGNTIIMVTHNPDLAVYADRVINMEDGKIVEEFVGKSMTKEIKELQDEAEEIVEPATSLAIEPTAKREKTKVRNKKGKNTKKTSSKEAKNA